MRVSPIRLANQVMPTKTPVMTMPKMAPTATRNTLLGMKRFQPFGADGCGSQVTRVGHKEGQ
jgi:hypothetical protein